MANLNFSLLRMGILFQSSNMNVLKLESKGSRNEHPVSTRKKKVVVAAQRCEQEEEREMKVL